MRLVLTDFECCFHKDYCRPKGTIEMYLFFYYYNWRLYAWRATTVCIRQSSICLSQWARSSSERLWNNSVKQTEEGLYSFFRGYKLGNRLISVTWLEQRLSELRFLNLYHNSRTVNNCERLFPPIFVCVYVFLPGKFIFVYDYIVSPLIWGHLWEALFFLCYV